MSIHYGGRGIGHLSRYPRPASGTPAPAVASISPGGTWTGTAGSGYTSTPSDPARTVAKPFAYLLEVPNQVFTADKVLVVDAEAKGGIAKVRFYCEGNTVDVTTPQWVSYTDSRGVAKQMYGYAVSLNYAACTAINASGSLNIYAEAFPTNGTFQNRVLGPFLYHNRATQYSVTKTVKATGGDFTDIVSALNWFTTNSGTVGRNGRILLQDTADYQIGGAAVTYNNSPHWLTIEADVGITAKISSGATRTTIRPFYDGLRFKGAGIVFDLAKFNLLYTETSTNAMNVWMDGITISQTGGRYAVFDGYQPNQFWVAPTTGGATMNLYFTDAVASDCFWGYENARLVRGCSATNLAEDFITNVQCWHNVTVNGIDSGSGGSGLRSHVPAIDIVYTGGGTSANIAITAAPGNARTASLFKNGAQVGTSLTITNPGYSPTGSGYTTWADIASWINTQGGAAGFSATVNGAAGTRRGSSVSKAGLQAQDMPSGSGRELNVLGGSGQLTSWFDVHGDVYQIFGTVSNYGGRFLSAKNVCSLFGAQGFFIDSSSTSLTDCAWRNVEIATDGQGISAISQIHSTQAHVVLKFFSIYDQPFALRTDALYNPDTKCAISYSAFYSAAWQTAQDVDLVNDHNNVASGSLPAGSTNGTTVSANLYTSAPGDMSPGSGMPANVGARVSGGGWNVANV